MSFPRLLAFFLVFGLWLTASAQEAEPILAPAEPASAAPASETSPASAAPASEPSSPDPGSRIPDPESRSPDPESRSPDLEFPQGNIDVYIIPITGAIDKANLFVLRRGLKEAIENDVKMVLLDMDTPGGRVDITIEMMEMLAKFDGITATYVNVDAISAGSFIAAATQEIYFAPSGKIGASAVIQGGGQEVPETARLKVESYLRANIRVITEDYPFRSDVIRAMLDADFELKIGDDVIKPAGELLTLTASEAMKEYALPGQPAQPLLGKGIHATVEELLDARFGSGNYEIKDFHLTYSEVLAKWMNTFAPALLGLGMLALFLEFKTPGFGFFGIGGIALLGIFFISQYIAGLAGNEVVLFFALGILLILAELFFFPGTLIAALTGVILIFGSLLWAMVDIWPGEPLTLSPELLAEPLVNLVFGLSIALAGALLLSRFFPGSWFERRLVLSGSAGGDGPALRAQRTATLPTAGTLGIAITDLFPSGRVEIAGQRYDARSALGTIDNGTQIRVQKTGDFSLVVESAGEGGRPRPLSSESAPSPHQEPRP
jgi:membrane-bound serine protease (ClpP class)